jgi:tetratricopeptide (TPR) repeat protein
MRAIFVLIACLLTACSPVGNDGAASALLGQGPDQMAPDASRRDIPDAVDGLVIGHRLMAAGEYELALRAYFRSMATEGTSVDALSAVGSANLRLGRLGQAEQILRRALEIDETFVPAHNNLGVALSEQGKWAEASLHFRNAFAFDQGRSREIRENYRLAIEKAENTRYTDQEAHRLSLIRRGSGRYLLLSTPL